MPKLSGKMKELWAVFIDPITRRRRYYPKCRRCVHECKQSFRVTGLWCSRYRPRNRASERPEKNG